MEPNEQPIAFTLVNQGNIFMLHNDSLVILAVIAKDPIERILVDSVSSINLIYWNCFKQIHIAHD